MNYIAIISSVLLNACAQIFLKKGMILIGKFNLSDVNYFDLSLAILKNPFLLCGFFCYGFSILAWMFALSRVDVSFAYPFLSLGYIVTLFFGFYFFNETINAWKIFGTIFILFGVAMIAKSSSF